MSRRETCPDCRLDVFDASWTKHNNRYHDGRKHVKRSRHRARSRLMNTTSEIHLLPTVPEVLRACGISPAETPWDWKLFDGMPNGRLAPPAGFEQLRVCEDSVLARIPDLNTLLTHLVYYLGRVTNNSNDMITEDAGQYYVDNHQQQPTVAKLLQWTTAITTRESVSMRALNVPGEFCLDEEDVNTITSRYKHLAQELTADDNVQILGLDGNITPRLTHTGVHHDAVPHFSTATGLRGEENMPAKLFCLYPAMELATLDGHYSESSHALLKMRGGCFFVLKNGETTHIDDWAHFTFTLSSSSLFGATYCASTVGRSISSVAADVSGGDPLRRAQDTYVKRIRDACGNLSLLNTNAERFIQFWPKDSFYFGEQGPRERLLQAWVYCWAPESECPLCAVPGRRAGQGLDRAHREKHVAAHLNLTVGLKERRREKAVGGSLRLASLNVTA